MKANENDRFENARLLLFEMEQMFDERIVNLSLFLAKVYPEKLKGVELCSKTVDFNTIVGKKVLADLYESILIDTLKEELDK